MCGPGPRAPVGVQKEGHTFVPLYLCMGSRSRAHGHTKQNGEVSRGKTEAQDNQSNAKAKTTKSRGTKQVPPARSLPRQPQQPRQDPRRGRGLLYFLLCFIQTRSHLGHFVHRLGCIMPWPLTAPPPPAIESLVCACTSPFLARLLCEGFYVWPGAPGSRLFELGCLHQQPYSFLCLVSMDATRVFKIPHEVILDMLLANLGLGPPQYENDVHEDSKTRPLPKIALLSKQSDT
ncbi:hypothetical protein ACQJBY_027653 [Aegilops geniculata]